MKERIRRFFEIQEEINFKEIFTNPARLFGYTYFYFLVVIVGLGIYFVKSLPLINKNTVAPFVVDSSKVQTDLTFALPANLPPVDVFKLSEPTQDLLNRGKAFYNANCSSCHGESGKGDGAAGLVMNPKPRNFTSAEGWVNGRKFSEMYKTLQEGIIKSGMPAFNHINPEDLIAVIHYIRTFASDFPAITKDELQNLNDTYKLSEGKKTAGQIPTSKALSLILLESKEQQKLYNDVLSNLKTQSSEFSNLIMSKEKFAGFLVSFYSQNLSSTDFWNLIKIDPVIYGLSPKVLLLDEDAKKNFYDFSFSLINKKDQRL
jgi:mono/diheme cytochrome c family protein